MVCLKLIFDLKSTGEKKANKSSPTHHKRTWVQTLLSFLDFLPNITLRVQQLSSLHFSRQFELPFMFWHSKRDSHLLFMCCQSILLDGWTVFFSPGSGGAAGQRGASGGRTRGSEGSEGWGCWGVGGWTSTDPSEVGATGMMAAVLEVGKFLWQKRVEDLALKGDLTWMNNLQLWPIMANIKEVNWSKRTIRKNGQTRMDRGESHHSHYIHNRWPQACNIII